jgi:hypothetical protein
VKLHLLIDTSVWLDLAKDYRQSPLIDVLMAMNDRDQLRLILPKIVVAEFERNKDRVIAETKKSLSSHFRLVREAMEKFADEDVRRQVVDQLRDVDHRIVVGGEAANETVDFIQAMFRAVKQIGVTNAVKLRAADRAIQNLAPFHRQRNSMDDALLIEVYRDALASREDCDVFAFVTHNVLDFSDRGGDTRLPHPDFADIFDGTTSRYATNLGALLSEYAGDLIEDVRSWDEFSMQPRNLSEVLEAEHKLYNQVWYNRHWNLRAAIESGKHKLVTGAEWESAAPELRQEMTTRGTWKGALASAKRVEEQLSRENIGPWTDFEWGMINGKLSALRWMLGDEWDMLDT